MKRPTYEAVTVMAMLIAMGAGYIYAGVKVGGWRGGVFYLFAAACFVCSLGWRRLR